MGYIAPWVQMGGILMTLFHKWPCWEPKALEICTASLRHTAMHADSHVSGQPVQRSYVWANQSEWCTAGLYTVTHSHNTAGHHCRCNTL